HDEASIGSLTFRLVPTPHLNVENVSVGKLLDAKATTGRIYLDIGSLFGNRPSIKTLELDDVTLSAEAVRRIPLWAKTEGKNAAGEIGAIHLRNVKLDVKPALDPFDADLIFARDGTMRQAYLRGGGGVWTVLLKPTEKGFDVEFTARNWQLPIGVPVSVSDAEIKGTIEGSQLVVPEFKAHLLEGDVNGTLKTSWDSGMHVESDLSVSQLDAKDLMHAFTPDIAVTGRLDGNFTVTGDSTNLDTVLDAPRVQGKFRLSEGSISNVDLVAVMQSDAAGTRAGVTKFAELTGDYGAAERRASFQQLVLQGGVLRGSGGVDIGANSNLAGRLVLEIRSQVAQDRGAFAVSGTVARPIIRRGG
ncbi:MAG TPA: AsmA-like C-terminal region-containing protein, partial [Usitatibacter sp.]|nr:AsmA-like C-terminal region-containing protein [Usitatibacter sp.]